MQNCAWLVGSAAQAASCETAIEASQAVSIDEAAAKSAVVSYTVDESALVVPAGASRIVMRSWPGIDKTLVEPPVITVNGDAVTAAADSNNNVLVTGAKAGSASLATTAKYSTTNFAGSKVLRSAQYPIFSRISTEGTAPTSAVNVKLITPALVSPTLPQGYDTAQIVSVSLDNAYLRQINLGTAAKLLSMDKSDFTVGGGDFLSIKSASAAASISALTSGDKALEGRPVVYMPIISFDVPEGKTAAAAFEVSGDIFGAAKTPAEIKVAKLLTGGVAEWFTPVQDAADFKDERVTLLKDGAVVSSIKPEESYQLTVFVKDNGKFDLNSQSGGIIDPVAVVNVAEKERPNSSGSNGCAAASFPALLLLFALYPLFSRKSKCDK